jgi:Uma2 family endonuclease
MSFAFAEPEPRPSVMTVPRGPYTADDLDELPDDGNRYEVLGGWISVSPAPGLQHQRAVSRLDRLLASMLPEGTEAVPGTGLYLDDGDCPIPDLLVMTIEPRPEADKLPVAMAHTVVEVVSPSHAVMDRVDKRDLYAAHGIPCYWRLERWRWRGYQGRTPALVVGLLRYGAWQETVYPAGAVADIPLVIGRQPGDVLSVKLDPATLVPGD